MMLNSNSIGNKIASARKKINLSQAELAQQVSLSSQAVGKWERGESMPDILTLNRIAVILGVDLNYFAEGFQSGTSEAAFNVSATNQSTEFSINGQRNALNWDMSKLNLVDSDFSGLKNLNEKLSSSNMQKCLFVGSNLSGLLLNSNNVDGCDFTDSDISNSQIHSSNLGNNIFKNCSLEESVFLKCNINTCDFTEANFTKATFKYSNFLKSAITKAKLNNTSFIDTQIQGIVFEGNIEGCTFENCAFYGVKFQNATLLNTFFKNNRKFKRVQFIDCKVDKITNAFLKNNLANLTGITVLSQ